MGLAKSARQFSNHPVWLVGFRPFFILGIISGITFPLLWALIFSGMVPLDAISKSKDLSPLQCHAHVLWVLERLVIMLPPFEPYWLRLVLLNAFIAVTAIYVNWCLIAHRKDDSFRDNIFFVLILLLFLLAKNLLLSADHFTQGTFLTMGLFRVAFVVMFERTMTQFMKGTEKVELVRSFALDTTIKVLVLASAFQAFLPVNMAAFFVSSAAALLFVRWILWKPWIGLKTFGNGIMYLGYLGLVSHLALEGFRLAAPLQGVSFLSSQSLSVHTFTFLCMGLIIPSMLVRISQGHTRRKPQFLMADRVAISLVGMGAFFRLVAIQAWPSHYSMWVAIAALCWSSCYLILAWRLIPFLVSPRIDGKVH